MQSLSEHMPDEFRSFNVKDSHSQSSDIQHYDSPTFAIIPKYGRCGRRIPTEPIWNPSRGATEICLHSGTIPAETWQLLFPIPLLYVGYSNNPLHKSLGFPLALRVR